MATDILRGIRVLDFTAMMAGPYCSRWLADLGAEVIKVEPPEGDYMRTRAPSREGFSAYYGHLNAGKKSLAIDLKLSEGVALARELARESDIVLEAFRPGVMDRLGLGAQALRAIDPRLIYCSISGFGQNTSVAGYPAYAYVVQAASGFDMANFEYQDGADRPANSGIPLADMVTAVFAAFSIQSALLQRERTGVGCTIDVNLMDSVMSLMACEFQAAQFPLARRRPVYKPLKAADGFILVAPVNDKNFRSVCVATGHPEWQQDPMLNSDQARYTHWDVYMGRIEAWASSRPAAECERVFMEAGVPCARYKRIEEAMQEPQFQERESFGQIEDGAGSYRTMRLPFSLDGEKPGVGPQVSLLGEHTMEVLSSVLGRSRQQIDELAGRGVLGRNLA